jgi:predicted alpha/beta-fold hydrolase
MPIIERSSYHAPFLCNNGHVQTILPTLVRRTHDVLYQRERIETPDNDFLDIDWARTGSSKLAILSHGLEGDSHRPYMLGMSLMLNRHGWDAAAWNYRGCSGEMNRQLRLYHNGAIDDLDHVVRHTLRTGSYETVALIGFSLGGNLTLVYLGTHGGALDARIRRAAVFSVPCDLRTSAQELAKWTNALYMKQFLRSLHEKVKAKAKQFPGMIHDRGFRSIRNFRDFDDRYTAPLHGFRDAEDYWRRCSSGQFIPHIRIPALIVNALDDPFLAGACYPVQEASASDMVFLEMPASGGHVGFVQCTRDKRYWSEVRAMEFLEQN